MESKLQVLPKYVIVIFFLIGAASALIFRLIIILSKLSPSYVRVAWYAGAIGYVFFFSFRFFITERRKLAVRHYRLIEKVKGRDELDDTERKALLYVLNSIDKSLEHYNYIIIFVSTFIAIAVDIFLSIY